MKEKRGLLIILLFIILSSVVLWLAPAEQVLGHWVKLIYFHASMSYAGIYTLYVAALLGAACLVTSRTSFGLWSRELGRSALVLWFISLLLSLISMQVVWGGLLWQEPMTIAAITILLLGFGKEIICRGGTIRLHSVANMVFAAAVFFIRSGQGRLMHPDNPIRAADDNIIKILPVILLVLTMAALFEYTRWRLKMRCDGYTFKTR